jgi:hypothetical protein
VDRDEFRFLPSAIALGLVYDLLEEQLARMDAPSVLRPPKFDGKLPKSGGFVWLSELALDSLEWWLSKKRESAEGGGQYAEKDAKLVATLEKWVTWRRVFPYEQWSGTRGDDRAIATFPCKNPRLRQWEPRPNDGSKPSGGGKTGGGQQRPNSPPPSSDDDDLTV